jgi:hypothetical protein
MKVCSLEFENWILFGFCDLLFVFSKQFHQLKKSSSKYQIPKNKFQINNKTQAPNYKRSCV